MKQMVATWQLPHFPSTATVAFSANRASKISRLCAVLKSQRGIRSGGFQKIDLALQLVDLLLYCTLLGHNAMFAHHRGANFDILVVQQLYSLVPLVSLNSL
jgi:hypothetical protein